MRPPLIIFLLIFASGFTSCNGGVVKEPVQVPIRVLVYVPIPKELTNPLLIAEPTNPTCGEATRVARERKAALIQCNADREAASRLK